MSNPILMTEEYWRDSQLSIARIYGIIRYNGQMYVIVNKEGKDIFQCSVEAEKEGREKAIEAGEPADLIDVRYLPVYREIGRDKFIETLEAHQYEDLTPERLKSMPYEPARTT